MEPKIKIWRLHPQTLERFVPHQHRDGYFRVADPTLGKVKHHAEHQIPVVSEEDLVAYIRRGYLCRMRGEETGQVNLIAASEIVTDTPGAASADPKASRTSPTSGVKTTSSMAMSLPPDLKPPASGLLPSHGRIACTDCFPGGTAEWGVSVAEGSGWRLTNNPMAWGGQNPRVLVLGFSKGGTQNDGILNRPHAEVAFRGGRHAVASVLGTLGLMPSDRSIDELIADRDGDIAFGSLVRCSVSKLDHRSGRWVMSGSDIMGSCLREGAIGHVISNCTQRYLACLPPRLKMVVIFGNDVDYMDGCFRAIAGVRPGMRKLNAVAYTDGTVVFIHVVHFKAQGGIVPNWCHGEPGRASQAEHDQPLKRELALQAIRSALAP
uniref:hypothetical protein n=1 Tax=Azospirillum argentinense TaxID=2970906 RepID=UPI0015861FE7|nr:hypothetical protein [Azospirillum argentinense]